MNVGIFTDTYLPDINGVVSSCATLKRALEMQGHKVYVVTNHKGTSIVQEGDVLRLPGVELKRLYGYKMSSPLNFRADDQIMAMHLDVIHLQTEYGVGLYGIQLARDFRIPLVYTYHTMWEDYTHYLNPLELDSVDKLSRSAIRGLSRKLGNSVQEVIAPSEKTRQALQEYGVLTPVHVVPTGLDLSRFQNLDEARVEEIRSGLDLQGKHAALFVGRLAKEKNLEQVMRAVDQSADDDLRLVVVGSGPDEGHFHSVRDNARHPERFVFTGRVDGAQVPLYYGACDCFVSASTTETQGMTYIEALASGLPVFGRRDPVLEGLLEEGITGHYFDDEAELQEKLDGFFAHPTCLRQACIEKAEPYTEENMGKSVSAVYEQAVASFKDTWKVDKMRLQDDFALLTLSHTGEKEGLKLLIPMDDFFELKLGMQAHLDNSVVQSYLALQEYYMVWMSAKRRLASKDQTAFQLKMWAITHKGLEEGQAGQLCEEFVQRGLVNDRSWALDKAHYWHDMGNSRQSIRRKLMKAGIGASLVSEALDELDEDREFANAKNLALRLVRSVKEQSSQMKHQTIINKLLAKGYSMEIARRAEEALEWEEDDAQALEAAWKKAGRLYGRLDPDKRREKMMQYCQRKGFSRSEVEKMEDVE